MQDIAPKENQGRESYKQPRDTRTRAHRLPDDWEPSQSDFGWANATHPNIDTVTETTKFKNYFGAKGTTYVNWSKAWMNWIIRCEESNGNRPRNPTATSIRPAYDKQASMQRIFDAADSYDRKRNGQ